jgi:hypothetical protein
MNIDLQLFLNDFSPAFLATVAGGVVLTFLLFLFKEKLLPMPDISGKWYFTTYTNKTAYKPFKNMELEYVAFLYRDGNKIYGTTEKIYEVSSTGEREYIEENRVRGKIEGSIQKNYLGKDIINIHSIEDEFSRVSTNFYKLKLYKKEIMKGEYNSMIADQEGEVIWQRKSLLRQ